MNVLHVLITGPVSAWLEYSIDVGESSHSLGKFEQNLIMKDSFITMLLYKPDVLYRCVRRVRAKITFTAETVIEENIQTTPIMLGCCSCSRVHAVLPNKYKLNRFVMPQIMILNFGKGPVIATRPLTVWEKRILHTSVDRYWNHESWPIHKVKRNGPLRVLGYEGENPNLITEVTSAFDFFVEEDCLSSLFLKMRFGDIVLLYLLNSLRLLQTFANVLQKRNSYARCFQWHPYKIYTSRKVIKCRIR